MINKIVNYSACLIGLFPAVLTAQIKPVVTGRECPECHFGVDGRPGDWWPQLPRQSLFENSLS